jgi:hypothetical protein
MTTHLKKTNHHYGTTFPACARSFRVRNSHSFQMSEDQTAVDCLRCAKIGGFTPKAKQGPTNPGGTCQVCFAQQRVLGGESMALHGYNRPGIGHIIGDCQGSKHLPFEKSKDLTVSHRADLGRFHLQAATYQNDLEAGRITELSVEIETNERNPNFQSWVRGSRRYVSKFVTVKLGDAQVYAPAGERGTIPSFETLLRAKISENGYRISNMAREMDFLDSKLATWAVKELLP